MGSTQLPNSLGVLDFKLKNNSDVNCNKAQHETLAFWVVRRYTLWSQQKAFWRCRRVQWLIVLTFHD